MILCHSGHFLDSILYILKATLEEILGTFQDVVNVVYYLNSMHFI